MGGQEHNVDICVTCVADKPPQLPLREELPSLGIEIIYNGKGVGAEAVEDERKKAIIQSQIRHIREVAKKNEAAKSRLNPPGTTLLAKAMEKVKKTKEDPPEEHPGIPKALSYGEYHNKLAATTTRSSEPTMGDNESMSSSIETTPTMNAEFPKMKKKKKLLGFLKRKNGKEPPSSVAVPQKNSIEDAAVAEAFNAFTPKEDDKLIEAFNALPPPVKKTEKKKSLDRSVKKKEEAFPDLLEGSKINPEKLETGTVSESEPETTSGSSSSGVEQSTVSSLGADDNSSLWKNNSVVKDAESFTKRAKDLLEKMAEDRLSALAQQQPPDQQSSSGGGNIRVKLLSNKASNHITEIYDLTDISERTEEYSGHEDQDMFRDDLLESDVVCHGETMPISPFSLYSHLGPSDQTEYSEESSVPVPHKSDEYGRRILDLEDIYEENGPGSPLVLSPVHERNVQSFGLSPSSFAIPESGEKKKNPFLPSFYLQQRRKEELLNQDYRDDLVVYRAEIHTPSSNTRERSMSPIASAYQQQTRKQGGTKMPTFDDAIKKYYESRGYPSPAQSNLTPAIRTTASRDSHDLKVSFSQDVEEHYYDKNNSSLAAIVNVDRGLNEPLPSALSREADEAFETFADQLGEDNRTPEEMLLQALSFGDPLPFDFEETIQLNPRIASRRLPEVDTTALHAACMRAFPKRFGKDEICRIKDLIDDLRLHRRLIEALVAADPKSCRSLDLNGDLPVHIMARQLMEWEGRWYQKVYEKAKSQEEEQDNGSGITKLYHSMSECINVLLAPVAEDDSLCLQSGSVGRILPLHIAAIFTVPYDTLHSLLQAFPNAATMKCDLSDIKTFVPTDSTPLQLHDRLSTDFPKWELQDVNFSPDAGMTQAMLDEIYRTSNAIRRSDLMYVFSPKLLPYRKEEYRIRRMEHMILKEMKENASTGRYSLTLPAEVFWIWLCEFQDENDHTDHYADSVLRIVDHLPYRAVRFLASVLNEEGHSVIDAAMPKCAHIIIDRLDKITQTEIPVRVRDYENVASSLLKKFDEDNTIQFRLHAQGFVGPLCRTIFHVEEATYPSSFIILPYKLVKDSQGRLGLESSKAAKVAMEFADNLSRLTSPKNIVYTLDQKIEESLGSQLIDTMNRENRESQRKRREHFAKFLKLYEDEPAYFYFIDDCTGIPIVDEKDGIYPLIVPDAAEMVEKVFPLMLSGMILMRGDKAYSILADVLIDETIKQVLPNWIEAAKDLVGYAFSADISKGSVKSLLPLRKKLIEFVQYGSTENEATEKFHSGGLASEWAVEMSLIKMTIEMYDPRHIYCGLLQERSSTQILWTQDPGIVNESSMQFDFVSTKTLKASLGEHEENSKLSYSKESTGDEWTSDYTTEDERPGMIITTGTKHSRSVTSQLSDIMNTPNKTSVEARSPTMVVDVETRSREMNVDDDDFDMNSVVNLRTRLEEQEATLESLRRKITALDSAGDKLIEQEERITTMIDEIINQKDQMKQIPVKNGVEKARELLLRICELEDRLLCREVEVGQLKNDVSCFEIETSDAEEDSESSSRHSASRHSASIHGSTRSSSRHSVFRSSSHHSVGEDEINSETDLGTIDDDNTEGNSTMYNSSLDGYPTGMLKY